MVPGQLVIRAHVLAALAFSSTAPTALAQERISPQAFLNAVEGKTVSFYNRKHDVLVGVEQFLSRRLTVWRGHENKFVYGEIAVPNGQICFLYRDLERTEPICWVPFEMGGQLMVMSVSGNFGEVQMARIDGRDLGCPETPLS